MSLFVAAVTGENSAPARPPAVVTAPPADQVRGSLGNEGSAFPVAICPTPSPLAPRDDSTDKFPDR